MKKVSLRTTKRGIALISTLALVFTLVGGLIIQKAIASDDVSITVVKYMDGTRATAANANNISFNMTATGAVNGPFSLTPSGFAPDNIPYEAVAGSLASGVDFGLVENDVPTSCAGTTGYSLQGYKIGNTESEALANPISSDVNLTNITSNKFVLVMNHDCSLDSPVPLAKFIITDLKYIDGVRATPENANNTTFNLTATWAENLGDAGIGEFTLGPDGYPWDSTPYQAKTGPLNSGSNYTIVEHDVTDECTDNEGYALLGYKIGNSEAEALANPISPNGDVINLDSNKFILVMNHDCSVTLPPPPPPTPSNISITVVKYMDGVRATATNANSTTFKMFETLDAPNTPHIEGEFSLTPQGYAPDFTPYEANTGVIASGANFSVFEKDTPTSCSGDTGYSLQGYKIGNTESEALANPISSDVNLNDITSNKFVLVMNHDCSLSPPPPSSDIIVTDVKYINGVRATALNANDEIFNLSAYFNGSFAGDFTFSPEGYNGDPTPYQAKTGALASGSDYGIVENGIPSTCTAANQKYALDGYKIGNSEAEALQSATSSTANITNITSSKFILVMNRKCPPPRGDGDITYTLTIHKDGTGSGTVTNNVIGSLDCGALCQATFNSGSLVNLSATAELGSTFGGWSGGGCTDPGDGTNATCEVTMSENIDITTTFNSINGSTSGSIIVAKDVVDPDGNPIEDNADFNVCLIGPPIGPFGSLNCKAFSEDSSAIFDGLIPGEYTVTEEDRAGYMFDSYSSDGGAASGAQVTVTSGTSTNLTIVNKQIALPPPPPVTPPCLLAPPVTTFDDFATGTVNSQFGWSATNPAYDQEIVPNTYGYSTFGCKSLRVSDAVTSGSFGDWIFSNSLTNEAGETTAVNSGLSGGTRQNHFEAQFDIASTLPNTEQPGLEVSVSPDRGDGSRMSYLRFEDQATSTHVFFDDYTNGIFNETDIASLDRTLPHTIKFVMDFVDGPENDVVKIYIDGTLEITGTSWEEYFRDNQSAIAPPTVDSLLIQARRDAHVANDGNGFLFDNVSILSGPSTPPCELNDSQTLLSGTSTQVDGHDAAPLTFIHAAWNAIINGATWIWSENPVADTGTDTIKTFTHNFNIAGTPTGGNLMIAADNSYSVNLNGTEIGFDSSENNFTAETQDNIVIPANKFNTGSNTLDITTKNIGWPGSTAEQNPAGLLFKAIVNNNGCGTSSEPSFVKVHVYKYLTNSDGPAEQVPNDSSLAPFPMHASWDTTNIGTGEGDYVLGNNHGGVALKYAADTSSMQVPVASYNTYERTTDVYPESQIVPNNSEVCPPGKFRLIGYKSGDSLGAAESAGTSTSSPTYEDFSIDKYLIVVNEACPDSPLPPETGSLTVTKIVVGGTLTVADFPLVVDGSSVTSGVATTTSTGNHVVSEVSSTSYTAVFSGDCDDNGNVLVTSTSSAACILTNTFNNTPPPPSGGSGGGGGGAAPFSGGGGSLGPNVQGRVLGTSTGPTIDTNPGVLPTCKTSYITEYMRFGRKNTPNQVSKLQTFLNEFQNAKLPVTGFFGRLTLAAVKTFQTSQEQYIREPWNTQGSPITNSEWPTGYVFKTTLWRINAIKCVTLNAPVPKLP